MIGLTPVGNDTGKQSFWGEFCQVWKKKSVWALKAKYVLFNNAAQVVAVLFVYVLILVHLLIWAYNGLCFAAYK